MTFRGGVRDTSRGPIIQRRPVPPARPSPSVQNDLPMRVRSSEEFLRELKARGARRLKTVRFRANRSTIWSLTQDATVLNLHVAYRRAPSGILDAFATIVRGRGYRTAAVKKAAERVRNWQGLDPVMEAVRASHAQRARRAEPP